MHGMGHGRALRDWGEQRCCPITRRYVWVYYYRCTPKHTPLLFACDILRNMFRRASGGLLHPTQGLRRVESPCGRPPAGLRRAFGGWERTLCLQAFIQGPLRRSLAPVSKEFDPYLQREPLGQPAAFKRGGTSTSIPLGPPGKPSHAAW